MTSAPTYRAGDTVKAFHPYTMGVVKVGTVVSVGPKYARIDFGSLLGGTIRVKLHDIVCHASDSEL